MVAVKFSEQTKIEIRDVRHESLKKLKKMTGISKDDIKSIEKDVSFFFFFFFFFKKFFNLKKIFF